MYSTHVYACLIAGEPSANSSQSSFVLQVLWFVSSQGAVLRFEEVGSTLFPMKAERTQSQQFSGLPTVQIGLLAKAWPLPFRESSINKYERNIVISINCH
jgi:hypothetical protein